MSYSYKILTSTSTKDLAEAVTAMLNDGWTVVGGVAIVTQTRAYRETGRMYDQAQYSQAMVRSIID